MYLSLCVSGCFHFSRGMRREKHLWYLNSIFSCFFINFLSTQQLLFIFIMEPSLTYQSISGCLKRKTKKLWVLEWKSKTTQVFFTVSGGQKGVPACQVNFYRHSNYRGKKHTIAKSSSKKLKHHTKSLKVGSSSSFIFW